MSKTGAMSAGTNVFTEALNTESAALWAATEEGRATFRRLFRVQYSTPSLSDRPKTHLITPQLPSARWCKRKMHSVQEIAFLREYDAEVDCNFENLEAIATKVLTLGSRFPPPSKRKWSAVIDKLIDLAIEPYEWALQYSLGEPPAHAIPRPYAEEKADMDSDLRPCTFTPSRGPSIMRPVVNISTLSDHQQKCLKPQMTVPVFHAAYLPVVSCDYVADKTALAQAEGQSVYSAVQAAAIYKNVQCMLHHLELSMAHGYVRPQTSCWAGPSDSVHDVGAFQSFEDCSDLDSSSQIHLCTGDTILDLGQLVDVISTFIIVRKAVRSHVEAAFDAPKEVLAAGSERPSDYLPHIPLEAGTLADWRRPRMSKAKRRKSFADSSTKQSSKRQKIEILADEKCKNVNMRRV
ncbi:hypothetical protein B0H19DRAFT_1057992 [Mycena capillaripes]|nr:hypothetical protein B0H19DRAFT_1057992 [Mycena capillaripes]